MDKNRASDHLSISILLVDDHMLFVEGLRFILDRVQNLRVIGHERNGMDALEAVRRSSPDIVLLDISLPGLNGLDLLKRIKEITRQTRVIILTMHTKDRYVHDALANGADGYVLKDSASEELIAAIRAVARGEAYLSASISRSLINGYLRGSGGPTPTDTRYESLSSREREVLRLVSQDCATRQIAEIMGISRRTVENHKSNIMRKLEIHSTAGLIKYAIRIGLVDLDEMSEGTQ